jgi:hypothetical protein
MGIRIHKKLGYGLKDVKTKNNEIIDKRFNIKNIYDLVLKSFEDFKKTLNPTQLFLIDEKIKWDFSDVITYDEEFGLKNVILFQPFIKSWSRYDNSIDYYENPSQMSKIKLINRSLYPFESYINLKTNLNYILVNDTRFSLINIIQILNSDYSNEYDYSEYGFVDKKDAQTNIVPIVPDIIHAYIKYLNIFNDENTILTLKPMIYTYCGVDL